MFFFIIKKKISRWKVILIVLFGFRAFRGVRRACFLFLLEVMVMEIFGDGSGIFKVLFREIILRSLGVFAVLVDVL